MDSGTRQNRNFSFTLVKALLSSLTALPAFPHGTNSRASLAAEHEDLRDQQAEVSIKHQPQDTQQIAGFLLFSLSFLCLGVSHTSTLPLSYPPAWLHVTSLTASPVFYHIVWPRCWWHSTAPIHCLIHSPKKTQHRISPSCMYGILCYECLHVKCTTCAWCPRDQNTTRDPLE